MTDKIQRRACADDHISVCICTFKRPEMLRHVLKGVGIQLTEERFSIEVVVVDNDCERSAESVVREFQGTIGSGVVYDCEPEQNIALARNKAVERANGTLIAFIDDDEYPERDWLCTMYECLLEYEADAVLGPVLPVFPAGAPTWLKRSGLCERNRRRTGSLITRRDMRTGNVLLRRVIFEDDSRWFDPRRGRTGGEDGEFIGRQMKKGLRFVWCDEALVFEEVVEERWAASFYLRKEFRIGTLAGEKLRQARALGGAMRAGLTLLGMSFILPLALLSRKHIWIRVLSKLSYNAGRLLSFCGVSVVRYRE